MADQSSIDGASQGRVAVLGVFNADASYKASRQPVIGETIMGSGFSLGPGGKGSNQAVAAARTGAAVTFITKLGQDPFAQMAFDRWAQDGITPRVEQVAESHTGSAYIFIEEGTGNNAIIVCPGAAGLIDEAFIDQARDAITSADVFVTQLEQPSAAAVHALKLARAAKVTTILNTAPAEPLEDAVFALCDYVTPNETETERYTGIPVVTVDDARRAADVLLDRGAGTAVITLGEQGVLLHNRELSEHIPALSVGPVVETTGAGDAFNGSFATALAEGKSAMEATRFGSATAGISVTRSGAADSMPTRTEVDALMKTLS